MLAWCLILVSLGGPSLIWADTLDRIAVTVGKEVITESQIVMDLEVIAFLDHKAADLSAAAKRASAERLVDQVLILREAEESHVTLPSTEAAKGLVAPYAAESGYQQTCNATGFPSRLLRRIFWQVCARWPSRICASGPTSPYLTTRLKPITISWCVSPRPRLGRFLPWKIAATRSRRFWRNRRCWKHWISGW